MSQNVSMSEGKGTISFKSVEKKFVHELIKIRKMKKKVKNSEKCSKIIYFHELMKIRKMKKK